MGGVACHPVCRCVSGFDRACGSSGSWLVRSRVLFLISSSLGTGVHLLIVYGEATRSFRSARSSTCMSWGHPAASTMAELFGRSLGSAGLFVWWTTETSEWNVQRGHHDRCNAHEFQFWSVRHCVA